MLFFGWNAVQCIVAFFYFVDAATSKLQHDKLAWMSDSTWRGGC